MTIESEFDQYIKNIDFDKYSPFMHGTTKERANSILKNGLLTRKDQKNQEIASQNIWGDENLKSQDDKTYFTTCMERAHLPIKACEKTLQSNEEFNYKNENETEEKCTILKIKNIKKYIPYLTLDEDSKYVPRNIKRFYSNENFDEYKLHDSLQVLNKLDKGLTQFYEKAFLEGGEELAHKLIDKTPSALFSIGDWGTVAINKSIEPNDLEIIPINEYRKFNDCRDKNDNKDFYTESYEETKDGKELIKRLTPVGIEYYSFQKNHKTIQDIEKFKKNIKMARKYMN